MDNDIPKNIDAVLKHAVDASTDTGYRLGYLAGYVIAQQDQVYSPKAIRNYITDSLMPWATNSIEKGIEVQHIAEYLRSMESDA